MTLFRVVIRVFQNLQGYLVVGAKRSFAISFFEKTEE